MGRPRLLRAGAWFGAVTLSLIAAGAVAPVSAQALPKGTQLNFDHVALLPTTYQKDESIYLYNYDEDFALHNVRVTIDTAKLAGVATAKLTFDFNPCTTAGTSATPPNSSAATPT